MAAARIKNDGWRDDESLRQDLVEYVKQSLKREEIIQCLDKISNVSLEFP